MTDGAQSSGGTERAFVRSLLEGEPDDLDAANDLEYLLALIGEAEKWSRDFDSDAEKARWVIAHWCQELQYVPDLSGFETGQTVPRGQVPQRLRPYQLTLQESGGESA